MATRPSVIPADKLDLLASTALAHVATTGPRGDPQVNPVWFTTQCAARDARLG